MDEPDEEVLDLTMVNTLAANRGQSTVKKPVRAVHGLCAELLAEQPGMRRKDLIQRCVDAGITYYTARTQVQEFLKQHRGGVAPAALQPEVEPVCEDCEQSPCICIVFDGQALLTGGLIPHHEEDA